MNSRKTHLSGCRKSRQTMHSVFYICLVLLMFSVTPLKANVLKISLSLTNVTLKDALKEVERVSGYSFVYNNNLVNTKQRVSIEAKEEQLESVISKLLKGTDLGFQIQDKQIILIPKSLREDDDKLNGDTSASTNTQQTSVREPSKLVTGIVKDNYGVPMPGASIVVKGTSIGTSSLEDGSFSILVPKGESTLLFSFIGMETQEIDVTEKTTVNIEMEDFFSSLEDVVVTGYQTISRERSTGAFDKLTVKDIETQRLSDLTSVIEGRVAGFQDGLLRGTTSMNGMTTPLYVIDGFPVEKTSYTSTGSLVESLPLLNMEDIESITVLKDAAATSIYGARAANGVVVIVTKKATKGKTQVSFSSTFTVSPYQYYTENLTDASDIVNLEKEWANGNPNLQVGGETAASNAQSLLDNAVYTSTGRRAILNYYAGNTSEAEMTSTLDNLASKKYQYYRDMEKYAKRNPFYQQYNLSIGKATDQNTFNASVTYKNNKYEDIKTKDESVGINIRNSTEITSWLKLDVGTYVNYERGKTQTYDVLDPGYLYEPYNSLVNEDGSAYVSTAESRLSQTKLNAIDTYGLYSMDITSLDELNWNLQKTDNFTNRTYTKLQIKFSDALKYHAMFQYEYSTDKQNQLYNEDSYTVREMVNEMATVGSDGEAEYNVPYGNIFNDVLQTTNNYNFRQQIDFDQTFGDRHAVSVIVGTETRHSKLQYRDNTLYNYDPDMLSFSTVDQSSLVNLSGKILGGTYMYASSFAQIRELLNRYVSVYGNAGYTLDQKYTVTGSLRWDRSNLWGTDSKYQNKPTWSVGGAWNIDKEQFFSPSWVNALKLRFSYGIGGNVAKDSAPYMTAGYYNSTTVGGTYGYVSSRPNPQLSWEKTTTSNLGIDFAVLNNRLSGTLEVYNKKGSDLLANSQGVPTEGWGYSTYTINNGEMTNKGFELTLNGSIIRNKDFGWDASLIYGQNKNEVTYVNVEAPVYYLQLDYPDAYPRVGTPYNSIYGYKWAGLSETGLPQVYDAEGNKTSSTPTDLEAIYNCGSTLPKQSGSFNTSFRYKNLSLSALFIFQLGHKVRNTNLPMLSNTYSSAAGGYVTNISPVNKRIEDRWTQAGDENTTDIPRAVFEYDSEFSYSLYSIYSYADINILDASNLRLSNISLSYTLPRVLLDKVNVERIKLNFNVENVYTWAKSKDAKYMLGGYSSPNYVFGLNVNF